MVIFQYLYPYSRENDAPIHLPTVLGERVEEIGRLLL
jgi:hypothetical protein